MKKKRVVITGIGAISPIGKNISDINESLIKGKSEFLLKMNTKILGCDQISLVQLIFLYQK